MVSVFNFFFFFFFFNDTATTEIYTTANTLSLHDALPIYPVRVGHDRVEAARRLTAAQGRPDRRSEEHTSELQSLAVISYAVFCLKKKKNINYIISSIINIIKSQTTE